MKEIKAPGTSIPGLIKAGTFYSNRGKEFWYVTKGKDAIDWSHKLARNESDVQSFIQSNFKIAFMEVKLIIQVKLT